eukprot:4153493-Amphidinium_carterae.2
MASPKTETRIAAKETVETCPFADFQWTNFQNGHVHVDKQQQAGGCNAATTHNPTDHQTHN